jgi:hypothetical protein
MGADGVVGCVHAKAKGIIFTGADDNAVVARGLTSQEEGLVTRAMTKNIIAYITGIITCFWGAIIQ